MVNVRQFAAGVAVCVAVTLAGCAERPMPVPASASVVSQGNDLVSYRAPRAGRVYVTDQADGKIVYQGEVRRDENVEVNAREDRLLVGGRVVSEKPLEDAHQYRIYFEPTAPVVEERVVRERVVVEPPR